VKRVLVVGAIEPIGESRLKLVDVKVDDGVRQHSQHVIDVLPIDDAMDLAEWTWSAHAWGALR